MRISINTGAIVNLIGAGLLDFILNKINREVIQDTVDFFNKVSKFEQKINKKNYLPKKKYENVKTNNRNKKHL